MFFGQRASFQLPLPLVSAVRGEFKKGSLSFPNQPPRQSIRFFGDSLIFFNGKPLLGGASGRCPEATSLEIRRHESPADGGSTSCSWDYSHG
jgi:hypothetical protein